MAREVRLWRAEDGTTHETEIEALRADVEWYRGQRASDNHLIDALRQNVASLEAELRKFRGGHNRPAAAEPADSYGSSGGGGPD